MASEHETLAARLHSAAIHLLRHARAADPAMGLTPARGSALSVLVFGGPRSIGELAAAEQVSAPTMTRLVSALEAAGLVTREPHPEDGRVVIVRATARAARTLRAGRERRVARVSALLEDASAEEWRALEQVVGLLERRLEELA